MQLRNTSQGYGQASILLHWVMAILIIALFVLGKYMVDLNYYDPWYQKAPALHRSFGVVMAALLVFRTGWRLSNLVPEPMGRPWELRAAVWMHRLFYALIAVIVVSGYLTTTATGQPVTVFGWFDIPATLSGIENQEDIAGEIHEWLTNILIMLVVIHMLAALKHHFLNRDATLRRILWTGGPTSLSSQTDKLKDEQP